MPPLPLSSAVARITVQALDRKAAQLGALLTHWDAIAGHRIGAISFPVKIGRGHKGDDAAVLTIASPSAWMTELQHESPGLLRRINAFFGHRAVSDIRIVSRSIPPVVQTRTHRPLSAEETSALETSVSGITDERLRRALIELGTALQQEET
jgi:hypothetical protein